MALELEPDQITQYHDQGWLSPLDLLEPDDVTTARSSLEAFEAGHGPMANRPERSRAYLPFRWVDDIMRHPQLVDMVEDLIGPNILCWNAIFWIKEPGGESFVGWHQDATYWGLDNRELVTAWVALSHATEEAGCMSVLPGSHESELLHDETYDKDNLLTRGQHIQDIDASRTVAMPLQAGQVSFHNVGTAHGSGANRSEDRRIGLSLHYMPTHTRQRLADWDSAALVRGIDDHNHFDHAPRPTRDLEPAIMEYHEQSSDALRRIVYEGSNASRTTL